MDILPCSLPCRVRVQPEHQAQAARQRLRLLLQQVRLGRPDEARLPQQVPLLPVRVERAGKPASVRIEL